MVLISKTSFDKGITIAGVPEKLLLSPVAYCWSVPGTPLS
jgi:hypothetical protein